MTLEPADWEHKVEEVLTDADDAILAEGERLRALAFKGALKLRKSQLVEELEKIEQALAGGSESPAEPVAVVEAVPPPAACESAPEPPEEPVEEPAEEPVEEPVEDVESSDSEGAQPETVANSAEKSQDGPTKRS